MKMIGEDDGGVRADGVEFVSVNADGLSDFRIFFKSGDNQIEATVAIEVGCSCVAAVLREREAEEVGDFDEVCPVEIEEQTIAFVASVGVVRGTSAGEFLEEVRSGERIFLRIADIDVVQPEFGFIIVSGGARGVAIRDVEVGIAIKIEIGSSASP